MKKYQYAPAPRRITISKTQIHRFDFFGGMSAGCCICPCIGFGAALSESPACLDKLDKPF